MSLRTATAFVPLGARPIPAGTQAAQSVRADRRGRVGRRNATLHRDWINTVALMRGWLRRRVA
jgi:hypothetical protein